MVGVKIGTTFHVSLHADRPRPPLSSPFQNRVHKNMQGEQKATASSSCSTHGLPLYQRNTSKRKYHPRDIFCSVNSGLRFPEDQGSRMKGPISSAIPRPYPMQCHIASYTREIAQEERAQEQEMGCGEGREKKGEKPLSKNKI